VVAAVVVLRMDYDSAGVIEGRTDLQLMTSLEYRSLKKGDHDRY
jgi:hypothetical protein